MIGSCESSLNDIVIHQGDNVQHVRSGTDYERNQRQRRRSLKTGTCKGTKANFYFRWYLVLIYVSRRSRFFAFCWRECLYIYGIVTEMTFRFLNTIFYTATPGDYIENELFSLKFDFPQSFPLNWRATVLHRYSLYSPLIWQCFKRPKVKLRLCSYYTLTKKDVILRVMSYIALNTSYTYFHN
jgi:hypothetical protein